MFIKDIDKNGMVAKQGELKSGDVILKVCIQLHLACFASQQEPLFSIIVNYF